jgi:hypothetical protein
MGAGWRPVESLAARLRPERQRGRMLGEFQDKYTLVNRGSPFSRRLERKDTKSLRYEGCMTSGLSGSGCIVEGVPSALNLVSKADSLFFPQDSFAGSNRVGTPGPSARCIGGLSARDWAAVASARSASQSPRAAGETTPPRPSSRAASQPPRGRDISNRDFSPRRTSRDMGTPTGTPPGTPRGSRQGTPQGSRQGTPIGTPNATPAGTPMASPRGGQSFARPRNSSDRSSSAPPALRASQDHQRLEREPAAPNKSPTLNFPYARYILEKKGDDGRFGGYAGLSSHTTIWKNLKRQGGGNETEQRLRDAGRGRESASNIVAECCAHMSRDAIKADRNSRLAREPEFVDKCQSAARLHDEMTRVARDIKRVVHHTRSDGVSAHLQWC